MNDAMAAMLPLIPRYLSAMLVTLEVSVIAAMLGMAGGFVLNALRLRFARALRVPYRLFVWLIRGTPYLSQLMIVYFGLPALGITLDAVDATVVSLAVYATAYFAEIFRASWNSVARGQREAAQAFGIGRWAVFRAIECPQAFAFALPLLANQWILVIKESAVASIITVPELTMTASDIVSSTYTYVGPYALLIAGYWLLTQSVAWIARRVRRSLSFLR
ncbi:ABC transporter permease [Pandoraea captiosa]|uniref:ABC transporter permease n=1 Tax=Pandoraea captiosa TaxID=2508302 RepID=A0A5E5AMY0_9BURK|nr:amino acid ABC transporter permease [Pandoraea captiosa]VVE75131.1 ABC transporter permease [Pandoraea captiosa]